MRVVVTGAAGFVGQRVSQTLVQSGAEVINVVRPHPQSPKIANTTSIEVDLTLVDSMVNAIRSKPDKVVHLAAVVPTTFVGSEATAAAEMNMKIDENLFSVCRKFDVGVLYASSTSVYGARSGGITNELSSCSPLGPYAEAKLHGEKMGEQMLRSAGLSFTALRINAPYGPQQRTRTVLRIFLERALQGLPLLYHGTGSRQQDFTYVGDIAEAVLRGVNSERSGTYNISGGSAVSMKRLAELVVQSVPNCTSEVSQSGEIDPQEGMTASYDISKAMEEISWQPQVHIETGIKIWANYLLQNENRTSI